ASGGLFTIRVAANGGTGTGTVTVNDVTLRDCNNGDLTPASTGPPAAIHIDAAPVAIAAIATPQTVVETHLLTITPSLTLTSCAAGPLTWSVSPALPGGASLNPATGVITWTPSCGQQGNFGPFTFTATAATGEAGSSNAFTIEVDHKVGTVTVTAITDPQ